ncbi:hypothetical protein Forpe1208_v009674 [Fusarium oxysporum f. sp. rapae]|uniref:Uncharacterized protein n=1 Tax=Fusarium oxysporum f. sp. rapae TaxID=485398 RepID=A0A8J5TTF8_FUSOX|nr:hypothetical protein Forpe1208_v009674 [Fusarium oxysporum f. sp. rapae]
MAASLNGTHPVSILSELMLAKWKVQVSNGESLSGGLPHDPMVLREENHLDHEPFEFLRSMDTVFEPELERVDDSSLLGGIEVAVRGYKWDIAIRQVAGELNSDVLSRLEYGGELNSDVLSRLKDGVDLSFAPLFFHFLGTNDYVLWSIKNDPRTTNTTSKVVLLFYASILKPTYPVLDMLLKLNIISPEMRTHLMPDFGTFWWKETYISSAVGETHSIWQYFLVKEFYAWLDGETYDVNHRFVGIVERFLRIGADHRFRFSILVLQWPTIAGIKPETQDTFTFGDPNEPQTLSFRRKWRRGLGDALPNVDENADVVGLDCTFSKVRTWPYEPNGPRREISFTGWIRAMGDFPGKYDVLQLVEERAHDWQSLRNEQGDWVPSPLEDQQLAISTTSSKTKEVVSLNAEPTALSKKYTTLNWVYLPALILES